MNVKQTYDRYRGSLWQAWNDRFHAALAEAYPQTNGLEIYVHNWVTCGSDRDESERSRAMRDAWWRRWWRIDERYEREYKRVEHGQFHGPQFRPVYCDHCEVDES